MTTELQNKAWSILPTEFKEEVRTIYAATLRMVDKREGAEQIYINKLSTLEGIFGIHNLTSDAEGEEMLYVSRKQVQEMFGETQKSVPTSEHDRGFRNAELTILRNLFGSKCLPDEEKFSVGDIVVFHPFKTNSFYDAKLIEIKEGEDKPYLLQLGNKEEIWAYPVEVQSIAETYPKEPKFKRGDKVLYKGVVRTIGDVSSSSATYHLTNGDYCAEWVDESDLEPYTEPEK